jgi:hypothetical protein
MRRGTVALFLGDVRVSSGVTDENGRFEFPEVGDDAHRVEACEMRVSNRSRRATADGVRGGCAPLRLALSDAHVVEFHFLSADTRKPVEATGVAVKAFRHGETSTVAGHESVGGLATSDAVEVPAAGSYDFDVKVAGHEAQRLEAVEVVAGRATSIELLLRRKRE